MDEAEAQKVVDEINAHLGKVLWMQFSPSSFDGYSLKVVGELDLHAPHPHQTKGSDIEISFESVLGVTIPIEWQCDTVEPALALLPNDDAHEMRVGFDVWGRGTGDHYHVFRFVTEESNQFDCIVVAERISYRIPEKSFLRR